MKRLLILIVALACSSVRAEMYQDGKEIVDTEAQDAAIVASSNAAWHINGDNKPTATMNCGDRAFTNMASIRGTGSPGSGFFDIDNDKLYERVAGTDVLTLDLATRRAYSYEEPNKIMFSWYSGTFVDFKTNEIRTLGYLTGKVKNGSGTNDPVNVQQLAVLSQRAFYSITNDVVHQMTNVVRTITNFVALYTNGMTGTHSNIIVSASGWYRIFYQQSAKQDSATDKDYYSNVYTNDIVCNYIGYIEAQDDKEGSHAMSGIVPLNAGDSITIGDYVDDTVEHPYTIRRTQLLVERILAP